MTRSFEFPSFSSTFLESSSSTMIPEPPTSSTGGGSQIAKDRESMSSLVATNGPLLSSRNNELGETSNESDESDGRKNAAKTSTSTHERERDEAEESAPSPKTSRSLSTPRRGNVSQVRNNSNRQRGIRYSNNYRVTDNEDHTSRRKKRASHVTLRSVMQRVSHKAALSTKKAVWDSNDISMDAAVRAVDQWEALYNVLRQCTILALQQVQNLYHATKFSAQQMEEGILQPVRDWIVLPAFGGMEQAVLFLQSEQAHHVVQQSMKLVGKVPVVGEPILCPALYLSGGVLQKAWQIVQYPIPSKEQVRDTVDFALTSSKWALSKAGLEMLLYIKRADANITRTLSHTQWKVLGSGPYATLDDATKEEVLFHMTERYCSLHPLWRRDERQNIQDASTERERVDYDCILERYEWAAHIKRQNPPLYEDLIRSGLLLQRGGQLFQHDEWLKPCPSYRHLESNNFFIPQSYDDWLSEELDQEESLPGSNKCPRVTMPLWFRQPCLNGKPPARDTPWLCFSEADQHRLENNFRSILLQTEETPDEQEINSHVAADETKETFDPKHPTIAQWYVPDLSKDLLVDQQRHAVSLSFHCTVCHKPIENRKDQTEGKCCCLDCRKNKDTTVSESATALGKIPFLAPPEMSGIMRPTFWRFHGQGEAVCRSNWFIDTPRNGLQPFDAAAQSVLEDAYLFLKWMSITESTHEMDDKLDSTFNGALLTVDVTCPDRTDRLVQFGSLTQATAIQKGLSAAVSINKLRVYRGAWLPKHKDYESSEAFNISRKPVELSVHEQVEEAKAKFGTLGETETPNVCLRGILKPPTPPKEEREQISMTSLALIEEDGLAVPTERLLQDDMAKYLRDPKGGEIDHLCLIVHGIGEMMQSIDLFGLALPNLSTIIDCCGYLRQNHSEVQLTDFSSVTDPNAAIAKSGRVEYLPVEWHEAFSILSQRRAPSIPSVNRRNQVNDHFMMKDISLRTIPNMREFANDTLMDVLYFMSPEHHDIIIDIVSSEMQLIVKKFREITGFNGHVSIIGHSLGSIIAWDILANQRLQEPAVSLPDNAADDDELSFLFPNDDNAGSLSSDYGTAMSESPQGTPERDIPPPPSVSIESEYSFPQLDFPTDNFFLLGSPVSVFLMIRNQRKPLPNTFSLNGCKRVFNIFHPYDPVAYRIEPCIDPRNSEFEPTIIKHWNGGFRMQYQTKRLWKQLLDTTRETQQNFAQVFEAGLSRMGLLDSLGDQACDEDSNSVDSSSGSVQENFVVTGHLNGGERMDYMLQEKEIENANEYVAALAAHSCYWTEKDLSLFIAQQITHSAHDVDVPYDDR